MFSIAFNQACPADRTESLFSLVFNWFWLLFIYHKTHSLHFNVSSCYFTAPYVLLLLWFPCQYSYDFFSTWIFLRLCSKDLNFPLFQIGLWRPFWLKICIFSDLCTHLMDVKHFRCINNPGKGLRKREKWKSLVESHKNLLHHSALREF